MNNNESRKPERMLKLKEVKEQVGFGTTAIYERIKTGTFPAPIKIGYASRWLESEIQAWIQEKIESRRPNADRSNDK